MKNSYKFRLYPLKEQIILIEKTFGCTRFIYNLFLNDRNSLYREKCELTNYTEQQNRLPNLKKDYLWLKEGQYIFATINKRFRHCFSEFL